MGPDLRYALYLADEQFHGYHSFGWICANPASSFSQNLSIIRLGGLFLRVDFFNHEWSIRGFFSSPLVVAAPRCGPYFI
jgi:hypothetical protein